jgi:SWI/SNF-related matrix-associated actin-dependent regulator of chromatin subfamily A-like protein 1
LKQIFADIDYIDSPYLSWKVGQLHTPLEVPEIPELSSNLFDYQRPAVERCVHAFKSNRYHILGDTMGLGKTPQGLQIARYTTKPDARTLTVCLANSRGMLEDNYKPWFGTSRPVQCIYSAKDKVDPDAHIVVSYSLASKTLDKVGDVDFTLLDEVHSLANHETGQTQANIEYLRNQTCPILGMSGTPIKNCPIDLWPMLYHFGPKWAHMTYQDFAHYYCQPFRNPKDGRYIVQGFRNTDELYFNLRATCLTRRRIEEVRGDLPEAIMNFAYVEDNGSLKAELVTEGEMYTMKSTANTKDLTLGERARVRSSLAMAKVDKVVTLVEQALKSNEKVCVFCHTVELAKKLEHLLRHHGAVKLIGQTPPKTRDVNVRSFQEDPKCRVFIGNIKAAGTAITLTASNIIIMAEASWVPSDNEQVIGRIRRHGQTKQTYIVWVIIRGSIDETVIEKSYGKKQGVDMAVDAIGD